MIKLKNLLSEGHSISFSKEEMAKLHKDGSMIKFVNRLEFSYINFTLAKQWR